MSFNVGDKVKYVPVGIFRGLGTDQYTGTILSGLYRTIWGCGIDGLGQAVEPFYIVEWESTNGISTPVPQASCSLVRAILCNEILHDNDWEKHYVCEAVAGTEHPHDDIYPSMRLITDEEIVIRFRPEDGCMYLKED